MNNVEKILDARNLTIKDLSKRASVTEHAINTLGSGKTQWNVWIKLASALDMSVEELQSAVLGKEVKLTKLAQCMEKRHMTTSELSKLTGYSVSSIGKFMTGAKITYRMAVKLGEVFGLSPWDFMDIE